jgi:DNA-directed RNA polymerase specialized sigma24 family protein
MNRVERLVRNALNPYSTSFARWWCRSGRSTWLGRLRRPGAAVAEPSQVGELAPVQELHVPTQSMAARRDAIDAVLAKTDDTR